MWVVAVSGELGKAYIVNRTTITTSFITHLLAQLEDGQTDGDDEREEGQLQGVPGLQTKDSDSHWDQSHSLQKDEHHDGDDDLLQLRFAGFDSAASGSRFGEVDCQAQLIVVDVTRGNGELCVSDWQLEGYIVASHIFFNVVQNTTRTACSTAAVSIAVNFDVISKLSKIHHY